MAQELKSQTIAVTGSAGFIGSYLAQKLLIDEKLPPEQLISVDKAQNFISRECAKTLRNRFIKNKSPEVFLQKIEDLKPSIIFHMGACSSTEESNWDYLEKVNVQYSQSLWRYCVQNNCQFYYASSAATYGDGQFGFDDANENYQQLKPLNLYGKSKLVFDQFVQSEVKQGRHPHRWAGFKFFNVYGPGEAHKKNQASVVQHAFKQITENGRVKLFQSHNPNFKDGEQLRDFVYVGDLKRVLWDFARETRDNGLYNLGTGQARSFIDLARAAAQALEKPLNIDFIPTPENLRPHYQYFTEAKMQKLSAALNGQLTPTKLEDGVRQTLNEMRSKA